MAEPTFDRERLDAYRLSTEYVAFSYRIAKSLSGVNRPARDQWLRAAQSIPLNIAEGNPMLTRLIQRTEAVAEDRVRVRVRVPRC